MYFNTGNLRRTANSSSAAAETYPTYSPPNTAGVIATPMGLLFLLPAFDWQLGLLTLAPTCFLILMKLSGNMAQKMKECRNALPDMSDEAVVYIRGVPIVKTFGQTIFRKKSDMNNYICALHYHGEILISHICYINETRHCVSHLHRHRTEMLRLRRARKCIILM